MYTSTERAASSDAFLSTLSETLGANPRELRRDAGLSLRDVAVHCGVSHTAVDAWERGRYAPRGLHLLSYLRLLGDLRRGGAR